MKKMLRNTNKQWQNIVSYLHWDVKCCEELGKENLLKSKKIWRKKTKTVCKLFIECRTLFLSNRSQITLMQKKVFMNLQFFLQWRRKRQFLKNSRQ